MDISPEEIHLWFVRDEEIKSVELLSRYRELLNEEETLQQKKFYFAKHRHQYLITRALIRSVLSYYDAEVNPSDWCFKKNNYGKPSIAQFLTSVPLKFNISHCEKLVVLAISIQREVGVDVEYLLREGRNLEIAESYFSPMEVQQLFTLPRSRQINRFFDLWTLKEAYIKAIGKGLSISLSDFSYCFDLDNRISIQFSEELDDQPWLWHFWQLVPSDIHKISLAVKGEQTDNFSLVMRDVRPLESITDVSYAITACS